MLDPIFGKAQVVASHFRREGEERSAIVEKELSRK
jgi:hypothetical protein